MESSLLELVRRVVGRARAERGIRPHPGAAGRPQGVHVDIQPPEGADRPTLAPATAAGPGFVPGAALVTGEDLAGIPDGGELAIPRGARVTPLAREEAFRRRVRIVTGSATPGAPPPGGPLKIAVGCDHGGFARKLEVLDWVRELGHRPVDLGCHDENAVDYPDLAHEVAQAVASGRCDLGILVDGAGIGSAMAANKVPGIRAANCHDPRMAANAREHNYANVLTLGGRMIDAATSHQVVRTFLSTPWGAERHGKRVAKISGIEASYLREAEPAPPTPGRRS